MSGLCSPFKERIKERIKGNSNSKFRTIQLETKITDLEAKIEELEAQKHLSNSSERNDQKQSDSPATGGMGKVIACDYLGSDNPSGNPSSEPTIQELQAKIELLETEKSEIQKSRTLLEEENNNLYEKINVFLSARDHLISAEVQEEIQGEVQAENEGDNLYHKVGIAEDDDRYMTSNTDTLWGSPRLQLRDPFKAAFSDQNEEPQEYQGEPKNHHQENMEPQFLVKDPRKKFTRGDSNVTGASHVTRESNMTNATTLDSNFSNITDDMGNVSDSVMNAYSDVNVKNGSNFSNMTAFLTKLTAIEVAIESIGNEVEEVILHDHQGSSCKGPGNAMGEEDAMKEGNDSINSPFGMSPANLDHSKGSKDSRGRDTTTNNNLLSIVSFPKTDESSPNRAKSTFESPTRRSENDFPTRPLNLDSTNRNRASSSPVRGYDANDLIEKLKHANRSMAIQNRRIQEKRREIIRENLKLINQNEKLTEENQKLKGLFGPPKKSMSSPRGLLARNAASSMSDTNQELRDELEKMKAEKEALEKERSSLEKDRNNLILEKQALAEENKRLLKSSIDWRDADRKYYLTEISRFT